MAGELYDLDAGALTIEQMRSILESFPADVTFSDTDNKVRFFTGRYRIFDRSAGTIGSDVVECHLPATRPRVAQLISELATGWRDEAVMLTEKEGRPVHVRYLPVRDPDDTYLGVLEVVQWADEIAAS